MFGAPSSASRVAPRSSGSGQGGEVALAQGAHPLVLDALAHVQRGLGEQRVGQLGHGPACLPDAHQTVVRHLPDDVRVQLPAVEDGLGVRLPPPQHHHQHALLALGEHHLVGGHPRLAAGDAGHVDLDAGCRPCARTPPSKTSARRRPGPAWPPARGRPESRGRPRSAASPGRGCRPGRRRGARPAGRSTLAKVAPWRPSRPVSAPTSSTALPFPFAWDETRRSMRASPTHMALTRGFSE